MYKCVFIIPCKVAVHSHETSPWQLLCSVQAHDGSQKDCGGWNERLFFVGQSGAQTFRLTVSPHCQQKTKECDLSMYSVTSLKTDASHRDWPSL